MQRIVVDTNVIVSSIIQRSYPYLIVNHLYINRKVELCISNELLAEYYEALARPKFLKFPDFFTNSKLLLADIELHAIRFIPTIRLELIKDEDDNMILELTDECNADFIITGNTRDFTFSFYKQTKIVTPKEYWEIYKQE